MRRPLNISSLNRRHAFGVLFVLAGLAFVFHAPLLRLFIRPITRMDKVNPQANNLVLFRSCRHSARAFDYARDFIAKDSAHRLLVLHDYARRSEAIGAEPSFVNVSLEMLLERGIPRDRIELLGDGTNITTTEKMATITAWLSSHPDESLLAMVDALKSGRVVTVANCTLTKEHRQRLSILGFELNKADNHIWWKSRSGLKDVLRGQLWLIHYCLFGELRPDTSWNPDDFEKELIANDA